GGTGVGRGNGCVASGLRARLGAGGRSRRGDRAVRDEFDRTGPGAYFQRRRHQSVAGGPARQSRLTGSLGDRAALPVRARAVPTPTPHSNAKDEHLKLRTTGRIAIAGFAAIAALTLTACGSDDSKDEAKSTGTTTSAVTTSAAADTPPVPTAEELNSQLQRALDPTVPNSEKLEMVQGIEADPELPGRLAQAYQESGATVTVTDVTGFGDTVNAKATIVLNGQENIADVPFVAEDGKWKVQKEWACIMLTNLGQQSPACV